MQFLFENPAFSYLTLRSVGYTATGAADIGEVVATAASITDGDTESWWKSWTQLGDRLSESAHKAYEAGALQTAADMWLRASNYYRTAEGFLLLDPSDPRIAKTSQAASGAFMRVAEMHDPTRPGFQRLDDGECWREVAIPYEETTLPGWWFTPSNPVASTRPTLIAICGADSTAEELYYAVARAAVARGWNCLVFEGPGQGKVIREQGLPFRSDWESVASPVLDFMEGLDGIDPERRVLLGMSQGGYFAARAAAYESRVDAVVTWGGVYDLNQTALNLMPPIARDALERHDDETLNQVLYAIMDQNMVMRWAIANGMWGWGVNTPAEFIHAQATASLADGLAERITAPVLIFDADGDMFFAGQPAMLASHLRARHTVVSMKSSDGAGEHCNAGSITQFHAVLFDWLDGEIVNKA